MATSGLTPCAYGGVEAMRAYQNQSIASDQFNAALTERRQEEKARETTQSVTPIGINQPINGATIGSIINTTA